MTRRTGLLYKASVMRVSLINTPTDAAEQRNKDAAIAQKMGKPETNLIFAHDG